jgi:hypothetical protein
VAATSDVTLTHDETTHVICDAFTAPGRTVAVFVSDGGRHR